jgi:hypothetical protein
MLPIKLQVRHQPLNLAPLQSLQPLSLDLLVSPGRLLTNAARTATDREDRTQRFPLPSECPPYPGPHVSMPAKAADRATRTLDMPPTTRPPERAPRSTPQTNQPPGYPERAQASHKGHRIHQTGADPRAEQDRRGIDEVEH